MMTPKPLLAACVVCVAFALPPPPKGDPQAVYALVERILPGASGAFEFSLINSCGGADVAQCFVLSDADGEKISIQGVTASDLTAGLGHYLREYVGITLGWTRGGGSNVFQPTTWPKIGAVTQVNRTVPYSYLMNVCTHSYTLVWLSWPEWEHWIDWAALYGVNLLLAYTGQEEIQYKTFQQFGLNDTTIRSWFNGPAYLTWSRGQNGHGAAIAGPLPRSFQRGQWALQKQLLDRYRSLGIIGILPAFQGNVPWQLAIANNDYNITNGPVVNQTGWMDATDPLFGRIADTWMQTMCGDWGCPDHWYEADGYFHNGTSWGASHAVTGPLASSSHPVGDYSSDVQCIWSAPIENAYLPGCPPRGCLKFDTVAEAQAACLQDPACNGVTVEKGAPQLRAGASPLASKVGEISYTVTNALACKVLPPDPGWTARGAAAYAGMARTDPDATWSFQGWAFYPGGCTVPTPACLANIKGFINAVPKGSGNFVILDMNENGSGQWKVEWNNTLAEAGASIVWTSLHTFGGNDAMKGNLSHANRIPYDGLAPLWNGAPTNIIGAGSTPEGYDQNPIYFELIQEAAFRSAPVQNITDWAIRRAHRRYGLMGSYNSDVAAAWSALVSSVYSVDLTVHDNTGVGLLPGIDLTHFAPDMRTPLPPLCQTWSAWGSMLAAAPAISQSLATFRYDLVDVSRELLAQLSTPLSVNFSRAFTANTLDATLLQATGGPYIELLQDMDALLATEPAFMLGPWLQDAMAWGQNASDCNGTVLGDMPCENFMSWNARSQITTWYPFVPGSDNTRDQDYARKQWSGLINDYYAVRAQLVLSQALTDAAAGRPLNTSAVKEAEATLAYEWTSSMNPYPLEPAPGYVQLSSQLLQKYAPFYAACGA